MAVSEEVFDVCDENDRVIATAPRSRVHAERLLHRAVHVFVFNSRGELLLQRRSATKDEAPLKLTSSCSGHLGAGEDYEQAAHREMQEEIELSGSLEFLHKFPATVETAYEHTVLYRLVSDSEPQPDPAEILRMETMSLAEAKQRMIDDPADFSSPLRVLLDWYVEHSQRSSTEESR
ncbi:Nudix hydrolase [Caulifigura coniformis]|uniref:Nudix hydrolase n=1 Tax=Caulifigura coniformis TaxID=2527983 RepID=A0A517SKY6_9PLAN|nr:NUDIX domain-containing protein [Caulifigura coniformis]QDT56783.1 Nudix hydrolase [Caulifigura coniformis]